MRIDVELDNTSINHYFEKSPGSQAALRSVSTSLKIIQAFDDDSDEHEILSAGEILKNLTSSERTDEEELESYKLLNAHLMDDLSGHLKEIEQFLSTKGVNELKEITNKSLAKYFKLKITDTFKKSCLHVVWENPEKNSLEITLQNLHETFGENSLF